MPEVNLKKMLKCATPPPLDMEIYCMNNMKITPSIIYTIKKMLCAYLNFFFNHFYKSKTVFLIENKFAIFFDLLNNYVKIVYNNEIVLDLINFV